MNTTFIKDILLIEEPSAVRFYKEIMAICGYFLAPFFTLALVLEYFGAMDFGGVVKRLLIIVLVMNSFFYIHATASDTSLEFASYTLKKASPRNLFMKKWYERKVRTKLPSGWDYFWIGNSKETINDLFGTALFLLSKILFIVLKLIYSTVYHLNYAFSGYTALCYFFKWTEGALRGTFLSLVWCVLQPFVLVGVLCIVGNSFDESALRGEVAGSGVDHMAWLFGVSLLIVATPIITYNLITGAGVQGAGSKLSELVLGAGLKTMTYGSMVPSSLKSFAGGIGRVGAKALFEPSLKELLDKERGDKNKQNMKLMNQKGRFKSPFRQQQSLDERLAEAGLPRREATERAQAVSEEEKGDSKNTVRTKSNNPFKNLIGRKKQTFEFDQSYWNSITPEHREGIRRKYGIDGNIPDSKTRYHPVSSGRLNEKLYQVPVSHPQLQNKLPSKMKRITGVKKPNDRLPRV